MAVAAPGSPRGHPRAAAGGWRWHPGGDGHGAGVARTSALGDCRCWGGPCESPQPRRAPGVSPARGEQLRGGTMVWSGQWWPEQSWHLGMGWRALSSSHLGLFVSPQFSPLDFLILSFSSSCLLLLFLLFLSSSSSSHLLLPPLFFLAASCFPCLLLSSFTSFSSHHLLFLTFPSSLLGLIITSQAAVSALHSVLCAPGMTRGHAGGHHNGYFRAGGGHSPLCSPQLATAVPTARVDVPGVGQGCVPSPGHRGPHPCGPACPPQPVKTNGAEPTMSGHLSRGIQIPQAQGRRALGVPRVGEQ